MEFKGTKGEWRTSFSEVKKNEHSRKFITIYSQTVANSVIAVAYSKNNVDTEVISNAKLIATAPEMFELLKDILETIRECETPRLYEIEQLLTKITEQ